MKLAKHLVDKPWGRTDIPAEFGTMSGCRIGEIWYSAETEAPLPILVKWLFTSERLSIQVHPNDAQAQKRGMPSGKEECWYVVDAEPGAVIGVGTKRSLTREELHAASLSGEIEGLMDWKPVKAGDYFYIPAGTVHAIGAGITLVEVQQYADITYRLYDYGRDRELHLNDGVAVSSATPYTDRRSGNAPTGAQLVDGPHFQLWYVRDMDDVAALPTSGNIWITPLSGRVQTDGEVAAKGDCVVTSGNAKITFSSEAKALIAF
ncbi:MAG: class I mannose-6-phosphate isomerase [Sphingorhabdus sp.]|nr:class I mannose-6-phosphate isomerase [Sphingorhabdus sp.]